MDSVYSGVVSLRCIRLLLLMAESNNLEVWATNIRNASPKAGTKEKVYFLNDPLFKKREGHTMFIYQSLWTLHVWPMVA